MSTLMKDGQVIHAGQRRIGTAGFYLMAHKKWNPSQAPIRSLCRGNASSHTDHFRILK